MLEIYDLSWYDYAGTPFTGTHGLIYFIKTRPHGAIRPFKISYKPQPSDRDYLGMTEVDHVQLHGYLTVGPREYRFGNRILDNWPGAEIRANEFDRYISVQLQPGSSYTSFNSVSGTAFLLEGSPLTEFAIENTGNHFKRYFTKADEGLLTEIQTDLCFAWTSSGYPHWYPYFRIEISSFGYGQLYAKPSGYSIAEDVFPEVFPDLYKDSDCFQCVKRTISSGYRTVVEYQWSGPFFYGWNWDSSEGAYILKNLSESALFNRMLTDILSKLTIEHVVKEYEMNTGWYPTFIKIDKRSLLPGQFNVQTFFDLKGILREDALRFQKPINYDLVFGEASQDAADNVQNVDGNTAVLVKELLELKTTLVDLYKLLQGDVTPKNLSSLWLSGRYGMKLTYQDSVEMAKAVLDEVKRPEQEYIYSSCRGQSSSDPRARVKLYFDPTTRNDFARVICWLIEWDLFPTLTNVWDIIPYSFVADWFVDIEGFLSAYDARTHLSVMNIFKCCYTIKDIWKIPKDVWYGMVGSVTASRFKREVTNEPYSPLPSFSGSLPSKKNIIDGGALIIQRL